MRSALVNTLTRILVPCVLMLLTGCGSSQMRREHLTSHYPLDRARAAVQLAEAGDAEAVDLLIGLLEDDDPGVRLYTILALERLCGQTYGYRYYNPEPERAAAVARWRAGRQRGEVTVLARSAPAARPSPPEPDRRDEAGEETQ